MTSISEERNESEEKIMEDFAQNAWNTFIKDSLIENELEPEKVEELIQNIIQFFEDELIERFENWKEYNGIAESKVAELDVKCQCGNCIDNPNHKVCIDCWRLGKR